MSKSSRMFLKHWCRFYACLRLPSNHPYNYCKSRQNHHPLATYNCLGNSGLMEELKCSPRKWYSYPKSTRELVLDSSESFEAKGKVSFIVILQANHSKIGAGLSRHQSVQTKLAQGILIAVLCAIFVVQVWLS